MIAVPGSKENQIDLYIQSKPFAENSGGNVSRELYPGMYYYKTV